MTTRLLTATGDATTQSFHASITNDRVRFLTATGTARSSGSVAVLRKLPDGGLTDFGIWATGQPDTAMSRDMSHLTGVDSTANRAWLSATVPTTYAPNGTVLWNGAAYAGLGVKWTGLASGERHAFSSVQMEKFTTGNRLSWDATSWEGRRCYTAQQALNFCSVIQSLDKAISGSGSGKITYLGAPAGNWGYWVNPTSPTGMTPCSVGELVNASVSVNMQRAAWWSVGLQFYGASYNQIGTYSFTAYQKHPGAGRWDTSYAYNITVPAGAVWMAAVPHISINSTPTATDAIAPVGEVAYCDMHRIWSRPYAAFGTPSAYVAPRKLTVKVRANRINLVNNPGFDTDLFGWGALPGGTAPFPSTWDGTVGRTKPGAMRFSVPANSSSYGMPSTIGMGMLTAWSTSNVGGFGWKPSSTYTNSLYVKLGPGCPPITITTGGYTPLAGVLSTDVALASHPELIDGEWIRLWATFATLPGDSGLVSTGTILSSLAVPVTGTVFWVDDVLSEATDQPLDYFDGGSPGADYLWAGTPARSSSHYYRGFRSSAYRLRDIVQSAVPHGTQFDLLYAQPPE